MSERKSKERERDLLFGRLSLFSGYGPEMDGGGWRGCEIRQLETANQVWPAPPGKMKDITTTILSRRAISKGFFRIPCQVSGRERERANDRERNPLRLFGRVRGGGRNPLLQVMFFSYISFPFSLFGIGRCLLRSSPPFFGLPRLSEEKYQIPVTQAKKGKRRGNECLRREGG